MDSASGKTLMPFPCFDLYLTAWRESETVFHETVVGAAILDFFATDVSLDDLEVDTFLFGIVTIIALTDFDLPGWNTGRRLVADDCCSTGAYCAGWGWLRALLVACGMLCVGAGFDACCWG